MQYVEGYENLVELVEADDQEGLKAALNAMPSADVAEYIDEHFEVYNTLTLLDLMEAEQQAEVFGYLRPAHQQEVASHMEISVLAKLFVDMSSDERADVYSLLDVKLQDALMRRLARSEREDLLRLSSYEEGTIGAVMTSDYATIPVGANVELALKKLRQSAPEKESIYQAYVIDGKHKLMGVVSLRQLLTAAPSEMIDDLMTRDVVTVSPDMPQSEAARIISRYDLIAIPVVTEDNLLVGMVTFDDAMDVVEEEDTETMHKSASVGSLDMSLTEAGPITLYKKRINWLVLLVFVNIFSGAAIAYYEDTIMAYASLLFFLPLLIASGGNSGSQTATLVIRAIATGDIGRGDGVKLFAKEILVSGLLGLSMSAAVMAVAYFRAPDIMLVVGISMFAIVMIGSLTGLLLPFLLKLVGWDPATASTPLVTTIADAVGVMVYFITATIVLGLAIG
ncbi:MAG: magnesium transporter [Firmicutes bacterium]|nr:magnesium transporter [Bacillota bacterium]